jgi:hypothetical protein
MSVSEEKTEPSATFAESVAANLSADATELPKGYFTSSLFIGTYLVRMPPNSESSSCIIQR